MSIRSESPPLTSTDDIADLLESELPKGPAGIILPPGELFDPDFSSFPQRKRAISTSPSGTPAVDGAIPGSEPGEQSRSPTLEASSEWLPASPKHETPARRPPIKPLFIDEEMNVSAATLLQEQADLLSSIMSTKIVDKVEAGPRRSGRKIRSVLKARLEDAAPDDVHDASPKAQGNTCIGDDGLLFVSRKKRGKMPVRRSHDD